MGKTQYMALQRLIRDNGVRYVAGLAMDRQDLAALSVIDRWINQCRKPTDWLAMRQRWAKTEKPAIAIQLTTSILIRGRDWHGMPARPVPTKFI